MSLPLPTLALQHSLARTVTCEGVGLHGGAPVRVSLKPAHRRSGIVFRRVDMERRLAAEGRPGRVEIPATLAGVSRVDHATTLSATVRGELASVGTVEHLIAALAGFGIDSCVVEVDGPEVPILDGSSAPWLQLLRSAGRQATPRARKRLRIVRPKTVSSGDASLSCYPADTFRVTCAIDFAHPSIGRQEISLPITAETFSSELAPARTFGFLKDVEALRKAGLALGGSRENAVILDDAGVVNGPLRYDDEFVRHKALDLVGDLALLGFPPAGHFVARKAGHRMHVEFARELLADPSCWLIEGADASSERLDVPVGELALPAAGRSLLE